jgi:hypothetical protein
MKRIEFSADAYMRTCEFVFSLSNFGGWDGNFGVNRCIVLLVTLRVT